MSKDQITSLIKEELKKRKVLLEEPEITKVANKKRVPITPNSSAAPDAPTKVSQIPARTDTEKDGSQSQASSNPTRDLRPGFNLYHGILTQAFTEVSSMNGEAAILVQKMTKMALEQLGNDEETAAVFQSSSQVNPKDMLAIIQKAMLVALNHVAKVAEAESVEKQIYQVATA